LAAKILGVGSMNWGGRVEVMGREGVGYGGRVVNGGKLDGKASVPTGRAELLV